jgi:hypothetical protein
MRFSGLLIKLALLLLALLTLAVSLTRAQPYDDSALRAMLTTSAACTLPCWQGIEPGATSLHDALIDLQRSEWVGEVTRRPGYRHAWWWNRDLPDWGQREPQFLYAWHEDTAETISMPAVASLWQLWLILGVPDTVTVAPMEDGAILYIASYEQQQVHLLSMSDCAAKMARDLWGVQSRLDIGRLVFYPVAPATVYTGAEWPGLLRKRPYC